MKINNDNLMRLLASNVEPKISIILPIHPETPQIEENIINYKNLLKDVKKDLELNYPRRQWDQAVEQLESLLLDRQLFSTSKKALIIFANNEAMEISRMEHQVLPKAHVGTTFLVQDLLLPEESGADPEYLIDLSRDRINVFNMDSLKEVELEGVHSNFAEYYPDFDVNANLNSGSYGGKNAIYHGHRTKSEEQQKDQLIYYQYLDRKLGSMYQREGTTFLLAGLPEVLDVYLNNYGNSKYIDGVIHSSMLNLSHREMLEKVNEYKNFETVALIEKIKHDLHRADNQERLISDLDTINFALMNRDIKSLISFNDGTSYSVEHNKMLVQSILNKTNSQVVYSQDATVPSMSAIVY